jgi:hypothetical protein
MSRAQLAECETQLRVFVKVKNKCNRKFDKYSDENWQVVELSEVLVLFS